LTKVLRCTEPKRMNSAALEARDHAEHLGLLAFQVMRV
jgi:hypothetical protein